MVLSQSCVYGIRASLYLAAVRGSAYISIREMSDELNISYHFLTKVLQHLTRAELLESQKGPKGGVRLARANNEVTILHIVLAIDGDELFTECILGLPGCGVQKPCPMHEKWAPKKKFLEEMMEQTSLDELVKEGAKGDLRITADGSFLWDKAKKQAN